MSSVLDEARQRWTAAAERAATIESELYRPGDGYGCPEAEREDRHRLESARAEADRLFRAYEDLDRRTVQDQMLALQRSQRLATWASFTVAAVVGLATITDVVMKLVK